MLTKAVKIVSNFSDYYDSLSDNNGMVYKRFMSEEQRGLILKRLRGINVKTIEVKAVKEFDNSAEYLVVYTDPKLHNSLGKRVVPLAEARVMYANQLASKYYIEANGVTIKFLQVGSRRFKVTLKNDFNFTLNEGRLIDIVELSPEYNFAVMHPIFSIDYINSGKEMLAIDFNNVQSLERLNFENVMNAEQVVYEIKKALVKYNKV